MSANYSQSSPAGLSTQGWLSEMSSRDSNAAPWDTSDPFFTARARDLTKLVLDCYIRQLIILVGVPGNVLSCIVFFRQGLKDRVNLLLFWLAVADGINLTFQISTVSACYLSDPIHVTNLKTLVNAKLSYVYLWASFVSGTLVVVMSVDRCLAVVMPLKAGRLLTYRPMAGAIVTSYLIPLTCYLNAFLGYTVKWRRDPSTNRSIAYMTVTTWFPSGDKYQTFYLTLWALPVFFVTVVVCCTVTIVYLRQTSRKRYQMTSRVKGEESVRDRKITVMLLFIGVAYVILVIPQVSGAIIYHTVPGFFLYRKYHNSFIILYQSVITVTSCLNSTINFFTYLTLSSRFHATLKEMCLCLGRKTRKQGLKISTGQEI